MSVCLRLGCWRQASFRSRATAEFAEKVAQEQLEGCVSALDGSGGHVRRTQVRVGYYLRR